MSWSSRRRSLYLGLLVLIVLAVVGWILFSVVYDAPTCFDGEQNGEEEGVDCGGLCERVCGFQAADPIVDWWRYFEVSPGVYNAVALVRNPNTNTQAQAVQYTLKLRDADNLLVAEQGGVTDVPPEHRLPIFMTSITTGERTPVRSTFVFEETPVWERVEHERPRITVSNTVLSRADVRPRLDALVQNSSNVEASDVVLVAVLSDRDGNAIAASQTVVEFLRSGEERAVVFTWPSPFSSPVASIDIIPKLPLSL